MLLYLTVLVTTATAECSFSGLKHIKTYLRNSMTQQRLNHCMLLHIHRNKTDDLDLLKIATEFIKRNEIILETNNNNSIVGLSLIPLFVSIIYNFAIN